MSLSTIANILDLYNENVCICVFASLKELKEVEDKYKSIYQVYFYPEEDVIHRAKYFKSGAIFALSETFIPNIENYYIPVFFEPQTEVGNEINWKEFFYTVLTGDIHSLLKFDKMLTANKKNLLTMTSHIIRLSAFNKIPEASKNISLRVCAEFNSVCSESKNEDITRSYLVYLYSAIRNNSKSLEKKFFYEYGTST